MAQEPMPLTLLVIDSFLLAFTPEMDISGHVCIIPFSFGPTEAWQLPIFCSRSHNCRVRFEVFGGKDGMGLFTGQHHKAKILTAPWFSFFLAKHLLNSLLMGHGEWTTAERQETTRQGWKHRQ